MNNNEFSNNIVNETNDKNKSKSPIGKILLIIIIIVLFIAIFIFGYLFGVKGIFNNNKESNEITPSVMESEYKLSGNSLEKFDLAFLQLENTKVNKVYSPLSIKYALNMLSEGSKGTSKTQIDSVIGNYATKKYVNSKNMSFANAIFIRDSYKNNINKSYTNALINKYNAEVIYDSFNSADNINTWVSNKTFNLVNNLYDNVDNIDFALINALAIDMEWVNKIQQEYSSYSVEYKHENYSIYVSPLASGYHSLEFDNSTQKVKSVEIAASVNKYDIVTTLGEEKIRQEVKTAYEEYLKNPCSDDEPDADTYLNKYIEEINSNYKQISGSTDFEFYDDENVKVFAKDLQEYDGTTLQYVGIMPKNVSLDNYVKNIDVTKVNSIINNLKGIKLENFEEGFVTKITGYIPMFSFDYELDLKSDLKSLGIKDVFESEKADISNLTSSDGAYIDTASHKANIEFSNDGIKAAAATIEGGLGDAYCGFIHNYDVPVKEIDLTFDNPYLFLIRDKKSGEVWFVGTVYEPIENQ